jgi:hypothetical protein
VGFLPPKLGSVMWDLPPLTGFIYVGSDPSQLESVMWDRASQNWAQVCGTQHPKPHEGRAEPPQKAELWSRDELHVVLSLA